ncbi:hypothetical protein N657DRAFT_641987 [Parathielavia appendiculata]|uniref:Uncharacterized protein n=1 Tax=Parathielavia appendiculata TaxID=2587402 RepID=A0AAN6U7K2_9PEZI|nr:hypothetical protein N657DRAFT_641987 [Parathielavia appendiculata]
MSTVTIRAQLTHSAMSYLPEKGCRIAIRSGLAILWVICGSRHTSSVGHRRVACAPTYPSRVADAHPVYSPSPFP